MTHVLACLLPEALKHPLRRLSEIADNINGSSHVPLYRSDFVTSGAALIAQYLRVVLYELHWTVANKSQHHVCSGPHMGVTPSFLQRLDLPDSANPRRPS